jgi:hypothetical protein
MTTKIPITEGQAKALLPPGRMIQIGFALAMAFTLVGILIGVALRLDIFWVWDDAYMYVRYADNLILHHRWSWNPGGEPTYGLTSNLYLLVVLPVRLLIPQNPAAAAMVSSLVSGLIFLVLLIILIVKYADAGPLLARFLVLCLMSVFAFHAGRVSVHLASGMDTAFDLAYLAAYILLAKWNERSRRWPSAVVMGVFGGLAFSARPDLMLYTYLVPLAILILNRERAARRNALLVLALTLAVTLAQLLCSRLYFHTLLPLPFYAKGLKHYEAAMYRQYRTVPIRELLLYLAKYWPLWLVIAADIIANPRAWLKKESAIETGLAAATLLFLAYYLFFVLQIMYWEDRFYYPTLPALCYLAARSATTLIKKGLSLARTEELKRPRLALLGLIFLVLGPTLLPTLSNIFWVRSLIDQGNYDHFFDLPDHAIQVHRYWFELGPVSALPDDLVLATTEVGNPAIYNPGKVIVDLAGLNETEFAHHGFSADYLLSRYHPDFIYLPHPHYEKMTAQIVSDPRFRKDYDYYPAEKITAKWGVAIRRDSKYYAAMRAIVEDGIRNPPVMREDPRAEK